MKKHARPTELLARSEALRERNDCAVIALAAVTGESYDDARAALELSGRKHGEATHDNQLEQALDLLGFRRVDEVFATGRRRIRYGYWGSRPGRAFYPTVTQCLKTERFQSGTLLAFTHGHVLAVVDGASRDNHRNGSARRQVHYSWVISRK